MLRQIEWWVQNRPITKNRALPVTTLSFWKFYSRLRTSYKEFIWCTNDPSLHIRTFCKRWSFIWRCFFLLSILNTLFQLPDIITDRHTFFGQTFCCKWDIPLQEILIDNETFLVRVLSLNVVSDLRDTPCCTWITAWQIMLIVGVISLGI